MEEKEMDASTTGLNEDSTEPDLCLCFGFQALPPGKQASKGEMFVLNYHEAVDFLPPMETRNDLTGIHSSIYWCLNICCQ